MAGINKRQAIKNVLLQRGMHVSPAEVVETLDKLGIEVSENFVGKVRGQLLRDEAAAERERAKRPPVTKSHHRPQQRKVPPRRG